MEESWETRYVDRQVDRAWLDLRLRLADRFAAALAEGGMEGVGISGPHGQNLTVMVEDGNVVVLTDELETAATSNVDEAAHTIYRVLHDDWQVVHPAFLDTDLIDVPQADPSPAIAPQHTGLGVSADVPAIAQAESREQLQEWVVATFSAALEREIKVAEDGTIGWATPGGNRVVVAVQNAGRIQFHAVLAREVGFRRAHRLIDRLSRKWFALKFFLVKDSLIIAQIVIAEPFVPAQLLPALRAFLRDVDRFDWVEEKVESKRARRRREEIEALKQAKRELEQAKAQAEKQAGAERGRAQRALRRLRKVKRDTERRFGKGRGD